MCHVQSSGQHSQSTRKYALPILQMSGQSSAYTVSENLEVTELDELKTSAT